MRNIIIFLLFFVTSYLKASNNPYFIKNYNPAENNDNLSSDLYCISQTPSGVFIFGTKNGIYTFDGINTLYYPVAENNYVISCFAVSDVKIYIGLMDGFGCLTKNKYGKYDFSLFKQTRGSDKIYKIIKYNHHTVFCSKRKLTFYDEKDRYEKELTPLGSASNEAYFHNVFYVSDTLYIRQSNKGLLTYDGHQLALTPNGQYFKDIGIFNIRKRNEGLEILSVDNGFYLYRNGTVRNIPVPPLRNLKVRGALSLADGKLCIYTSNDGLVIVDSLYRLYTHISYQNGLKSGKINSVALDFYGNIWTAGENGFHYISYGSSVMSFNITSGLPGKIHGVSMQDSLVYVSSSLGLYYASDHNLYAFKQHDKIRSAAWEMIHMNNYLLVATDNGLYSIRGNVMHKITDDATQYLYASEDKRSFYCVGKKVISHYDADFKLLDSIRLENRQIENITGCVFSSTSDALRIYLSIYNSGTSFNGSILCYTLARQKLIRSRVIQIQNKIGEIHPFNSNLYFSTNDANYLIHNNSLSKNSGFWDKYGALQASYKDSSFNIAAIGGRIGRIISNSSIGFDDFNAISFQKIFSIIRLKDNLYFATDKGLYVFFADRPACQRQVPRFTLSFVDKNNIYDFSDSIVHLNLPFYQNSFSILFTSTYFENNNPALFYWRILENSQEWTENNHQNIASFLNVSPGNYTFEIKSRSVYGAESPVKKIHITILRPWYKTTLAYVVYILILIGFIFLGVRIYVWRLKQQNILLENKVNERTRELILKNREIELQKTEINNAHREITDSIYYAKRIQTAVLPSIDSIKKMVDDFFMFYRPRNVVSGDFYWINKIDDSVVFIAADCTGHGVSGAFMSLLGISMLNEIILEKKITSPDQILNNLRDQLVNMLNPNGTSEYEGVVLDGMDISVCSLNKKTNELLFAGAYNKMFLVRTSTGETIEIEADPMPVGYYEIMKPFSLQKVQFTEGDVVILSSDGYKDQFGGPDGKKFMLKRFRELLPVICRKTSDPEKILEETFLNWKGNGDQVDDIMVIGFSITNDNSASV